MQLTTHEIDLVAAAVRRAELKTRGLMGADDYAPDQVLAIHSEIVLACLGSTLDSYMSWPVGDEPATGRFNYRRFCRVGRGAA